jgi:hypothetical protein
LNSKQKHSLRGLKRGYKTALKKKPKKRAEVSLTLMKKLRARAVFLRDGQACVKCGATNGLAPSHVYPQGRYPRMAWEMDNIKALCNACHMFWWHKHPLAAAEWFKEKYPERAEKLRLMAQDTNLPKVDFVALKPVFEELIKKYEKEYYGYNR